MFLSPVLERDPLDMILSGYDVGDIEDILVDMFDRTLELGLRSDTIYAYAAYRLAVDCSPLAKLCEMRYGVERGSLGIFVPFMAKLLDSLRCFERDVLLTAELTFLSSCSVSLEAPILSPRAAVAIDSLAAALRGAADAEAAVGSLADYYARNGSGMFALYRSFRWERGIGMVPADDTGDISLADLKGYDEQKQELTDCIRGFLDGRDANNVLLYGDSGTGKSTSARALLNEPDFIVRGLRMIELDRDAFSEIPSILSAIRRRPYRFVLFMDDLSFEEYETEYKYLKSAIEGGIERRPKNVMILATSNRRNIIREVWNDRRSSNEDVHGRDTMQEKLSLADRFGVTIWYSSVSKDEYLDIVRYLAAKQGLSLPQDELETMALRWEIERGGFTGRTASQFISSLSVPGRIDM